MKNYIIVLILVFNLRLIGQIGFISKSDSMTFFLNKAKIEKYLFDSLSKRHGQINLKCDTNVSNNYIAALSRKWRQTIDYSKYDIYHNDSIYGQLIKNAEIAYLYGYCNDTIKKEIKKIIFGLYVSKFVRLYYSNSNGDTSSYAITKAIHLLTERDIQFFEEEYWRVRKLFHDDFTNYKLYHFFDEQISRKFDITFYFTPLDNFLFTSEFSFTLSELQKEKITKQRNIIIVAIAVTFICLIFIILLVRRRTSLLKSVEASKIEIEKINHLLKEKNQEILDSIHYAKRIQDALITNQKYIDKTLTRMQNKTSSN